VHDCLHERFWVFRRLRIINSQFRSTLIDLLQTFNTFEASSRLWAKLIQIPDCRERSLLYKSKGKDHIPSTSQKAGLTGLYKKFLFISTTAISKLVFQEVDSTVIIPLTFVQDLGFPADSNTVVLNMVVTWRLLLSWDSVDSQEMSQSQFSGFPSKRLQNKIVERDKHSYK